jgi:hypothetical protein
MTWSIIISTLSSIDNPIVLIALVSVVALLVVAQCVRSLCNALTKEKNQ